MRFTAPGRSPELTLEPATAVRLPATLGNVPDVFPVVSLIESDEIGYEVLPFLFRLYYSHSTVPTGFGVRS